MNSRQSNNDRVNRAMMLSCFLKLSLADVIALSFRMINVIHNLFLISVTINSLIGNQFHLKTLELI